MSWMAGLSVFGIRVWDRWVCVLSPVPSQLCSDNLLTLLLCLPPQEWQFLSRIPSRFLCIVMLPHIHTCSFVLTNCSGGV